jgi:transcriptional regulator with XRE-family HTH domain
LKIVSIFFSIGSMDTPIGKKIVELRKKLGLKQGEFAKKLGIKQSVISNIETGQNGITDANIRLICVTFGINEEWLRNSSEYMFSQKGSLYEKELLEVYRSLLPATQKVVLNNVKDLLEAQNKIMEEIIIPVADGGFEEDRDTG